MERTLVLIKPDAIHRGLSGVVLSRLEARGLKIVGLKMLHMDRELAERHYAIHRGKPFFSGLVEYITSCPVIAAVMEGEGAVEAVRAAMGATDPLKATPGTIRGDLALSIGRNLIHGSDSPQSAEEEISLFFSPREIYPYARDIDRWIL